MMAHALAAYTSSASYPRLACWHSSIDLGMPSTLVPVPSSTALGGIGCGLIRTASLPAAATAHSAVLLGTRAPIDLGIPSKLVVD